MPTVATENLSETVLRTLPNSNIMALIRGEVSPSFAYGPVYRTTSIDNGTNWSALDVVITNAIGCKPEFYVINSNTFDLFMRTNGTASTNGEACRWISHTAANTFETPTLWFGNATNYHTYSSVWPLSVTNLASVTGIALNETKTNSDLWFHTFAPTTAYAATNVAETLLLHYTFSEGTGTSLTDSAGTNTGTLTDGTWIPNASGYCVSFNGTSSYAKTAATLNLGTNLITVCMWIYWEAFADDDHIAMELSANYNSTDNAFILDPNTPTSVARLGIQSSVTTSKYRREDFARWGAQRWAHLACVYDNSTALGNVKFFVNGIESSGTLDTNTKDQSGNFANDTLYLFSRGGASLFAAGRLDDFRIYGGELSTADIVNVMHQPQ